MSVSTVCFDMDLQVIRGSKLSSKSSDYIVEDLIRRGSFARIAKCVKSANNKMVAVKISKVDSLSEAEKKDSTLLKLKAFNPDIWNFVRWDSSFIYKGHLCQEFELLDMSLKDYINMRQTPSLKLKDVRYILYQVATTLQLLWSLGIVHANLNPQNIMLVDHVKQPFKVKVVDSGSAWDVSKGEQVSYIQPKFYRAPEAILGLPCNEAIDMWALGCIAAELFLGYVLYPACCDYELLWFITKTQGELPRYFLKTGLKTSHFYKKTWPNIWIMKPPFEFGCIPWNYCGLTSLDDLKTIGQTPGSHQSKAAPVEEKAFLEAFVELVKEMLLLDPYQRITPNQVLKNPFIGMSHLVDFCCTKSKSLSSDQGESDQSSSGSTSETQSPEKQGETEPDQPSPRSTSEAQGPEKQLQVSEGDESCLISSKQLEKRAYDDVLQECNKGRDSLSPERKKVKIDGEGSQVKSPQILRSPLKTSYGLIYQGTKRLHEFSPPEAKKRRMTPGTGRNSTKSPTPKEGLKEGQDNISPEITTVKIHGEESQVKTPQILRSPPKRPYAAVYPDIKRIPEISPPETKKSRLTPGSEINDTESPRTPNEDCSGEMHAPKRVPVYVNQDPEPQIWIIGSSYIQRGRKAAYQMFGDNFGLCAKVEWFGKGSMGWKGVLPRFYAEIPQQSPPDILVIHAGGNDLGQGSAEELAAKMEEDLIKLHEEFPSMLIAFSCINERVEWRNGKPWKINDDRKTVNQHIREAVDRFGGDVIEHPLLRFHKENLFLDDGVHFTNRGNEVFLTDIYNTLQKMLQK